jgi:hypothetical protein
MDSRLYEHILELLGRIARDECRPEDIVQLLCADELLARGEVADSRAPEEPVTRLWRFVQEGFGGGDTLLRAMRLEYQAHPHLPGVNPFAHGPLASEPALLGAAVRLVSSARSAWDGTASPFQRALLLSSEALLHSVRAYPDGTRHARWDEETALSARLYREATSLLSGTGGEEKLRRHLLWLAAALLFERKEWSAATLCLEGACHGHPGLATDGLYFNIGTRFFGLPQANRDRLRTAILQDLTFANAYIPAVELGEKGPGAPPGLASITRESGDRRRPWDGNSPEEDFHLVEANYAEYCGPVRYLDTFPERLAVTAMLACDNGGGCPETVERWQYEAVRLFDHWPRFLEDNPGLIADRHADELLAELRKLRASREWQYPKLPPRAPQAWRDALDGRMREPRLGDIEAECRRVLATVETVDEPVLLPELYQRLTVCISKVRSTDEALRELQPVLERFTSQEASPQQRPAASLYRQRAWLLENSGRTGEAADELCRAYAISGQAADIRECLRINRRGCKISMRLGEEGEAKRFNDMTLTLALIWGAWALGYFVPLRNGYGRNLHTTGWMVTGQAPYDFALDFQSQERAGDSRLLLDWLLEGGPPDLNRTDLAQSVADGIKSFPPAVKQRVAYNLKPLFGTLRPLCANRACRGLANFFSEPSHPSAVRADAFAELLYQYRAELASCRKSQHARRMGNTLARTLTSAVTEGYLNDPSTIIDLTAWVKADAWEPDQPAKWSELLGSPELEGDYEVAAVTATEIQECLRREHPRACAVEFLVGKAGTAALCVSADEVRLISTQANTQFLSAKWQEFRKMTREKLGERDQSPFRALDAFTCDAEAGGGPILAEFWELWAEIGEAVFGPDLVRFLESHSLVYLAPHFGLHRFPIHLLPAGGHPLALRQPVLYLPAVAHLARPPIVAQKAGVYVAVDEDDPDIQDAFNGYSLPGVNRWSNPVFVSRRLKEMAAAREALIFAHGILDEDPRLNRVMFPGASRLRVVDVERCGLDFSGTEVHVVACNSGRALVDRSVTRLSFCSAFLNAAQTLSWDVCGSR